MIKIPSIDFNFWYNYSKDLNHERDSSNKPIVNRHHYVINMIYEKYKKENIKTAYFTNYKSEKEINNEIRRLKGLTYFELENYIINCIKIMRENHFVIDNKSKKDEMLKIFDLIQIWGGIPGGGGPYQSRKNKRTGVISLPWRSNKKIDWLEEYKQGALLASNGNIEAYDKFREIKHLGGLAFASKHAYFFSKHLNNKSLVIIDIKIAHCFKIHEANNININDAKEILSEISNSAKKYQLFRWQIEKALFTFHLTNFKGQKRIKNNFGEIDDKIIVDLQNWYNGFSKVKNKNRGITHQNINNYKTSVFKLTTKNSIHYTYRKNIDNIDSLRRVMSYAMKSNQNWPKKWFDKTNKIEKLKTFNTVDEVKAYIKKRKL